MFPAIYDNWAARKTNQNQLDRRSSSVGLAYLNRRTIENIVEQVIYSENYQ